MENVKRLNVKKMTIVGVLGAISIVLGMTPLGFIPVGPTRATIMHIPVIIGAITSGPLVGALIGMVFGFFSVFQAITNPTPVSFVFLNPLVSILPRVLIGITSYYAYVGIKKIGKEKSKLLIYLVYTGIIIYLISGIYRNLSSGNIGFNIIVNLLLLSIILVSAFYTLKKVDLNNLDIIGASILGTMTNTVGVLTMIYFLYGESFVRGLGMDVEFARRAIMTIGITNGLPESIIAVIIVLGVATPLKLRETK